MKLSVDRLVDVSITYEEKHGVDIDIAAFVVSDDSVPRLLYDSYFYYYDNEGNVSTRARYVEEKRNGVVTRRIRTNPHYLLVRQEMVVMVASIYRAEDRGQTFSSLPVTLTVGMNGGTPDQSIRLDEEYPHYAALQIGHVTHREFEYIGYPVNVDLRSYLGVFRPGAKVIY